MLTAIGSIAGCGLVLEGTLGEPSRAMGPDGATEPTDATSSDDERVARPVDEADARPDSEADVPADAADAAPVTAGNALSFGGSAYVAVGSLSIPSNFTIEAWVRPTSTPGETYVVAKDRSGQGGAQCRLGLLSTGQAFFILSDTNGGTYGLYGTDYTLRTPAALPLNAWSHLAVTKSGAQFALYVNGASVAQVTASSVFSYGGPAVELRIGGRVGSNGTSLSGGFNGTIDEVRLWKVARTQGEITAHMRSPIVLSSPEAADLVASWRFDEGSGTTTADQKGAANGTLVGGPTWVVSGAY
jgi:hypothetical protein